MNRKSIKGILLMLVILAVGVLLAMSVSSRAGDGTGFFAEGLIRSETVVILTVLSLALPALLIILLLIMAFMKPEAETITANA